MKSRCIRGFCVTLMVAISVVLCCNVFAASGEGGSGSGSTDKGCTDSKTWTNHRCSGSTPETPYGGGAWYIFKTSKDVWTKYQLYKNYGPQYCKNGDYDKSGCTTVNALDDGGYDKNLAIRCSADMYEYYAAYVLDGWNGRNGNGDSPSKLKNLPSRWGPYGWEKKYNGRFDIHYNNDGAVGWSKVKSGIKDGTLKHGQKITKAAAKTMCKVDSSKGPCGSVGEETIPTGTGYICLRSVKLKVFAVDESGNKLKNNPVYTDSGIVGDISKFTAKVASNTISKGGVEYTFKKEWRTTETGQAVATKSKTYKVSINNNSGKEINIYAVYSPTPTPDPDPVCDPTKECCDGVGVGCPIDETETECGRWTPSEYTNSTSTSGYTRTVSRVKNVSVASQSDWSTVVYAKPHDEVNWIHCYYPGVQKVFEQEITKIGTHKNEISANCSGWDSSCPYTSSYSLTNGKISQIDTPWQNRFTIGSSGAQGSNNSTVSFNSRDKGSSFSSDVGNSEIVEFKEDTNNEIKIEHAGDKLWEDITTGIPQSASIGPNHGPHEWACGWQYDGEQLYGHTPTYSCNCTTDSEGKQSCQTCGGDPIYKSHYSPAGTCDHSESWIEYSINRSPFSSQADVLVPYNFQTDTEMTGKDSGSDYVFAGDTETVEFELEVLPKDNSITEDNYATKAPVQYYVEVCYEGGCAKTSTRSETLNNNGTDDQLENGSTVTRSFSVSIPDATAGSEVCMRSWIYPQTSGGDDNYSDTNGNRTWVRSDDVCYIVAKKPSLQIWGGNVYSRGKIETAVADKRHLATGGYTSANGDAYGHHIFGSWGELGVIANGGVPWFASGASTGYASGNNNLKSNGRWPAANSPFGAGGSSSTNFASRSKLTISNTPEIGKIGANNNTNKAANDKEAIINMLASATAGNSSAYEYHDGNFTLDGNVINVGGFTKTIRVDGDLTITGNLTYSGSYVALADVPKLILYAKNINISCSVTRIDALLIADGTVDTCTDANGNGVYNTNDPRLSRQLVINGAVVANELIPSRTYGAATGSESITPAEIINFDPTLYRFGNSTRNSTDDSTGRLEVTYIRELAPRK